MNSVTYVTLALCVVVALADESRSKKEVGYNTPNVQNTDLNKYLAAGGYDHTYYNNPTSAHSPDNQPQNNYQPQPFQAYNYQQPLSYRQYNGYQQAYQQQQLPYNGYPYYSNRQNYGQFGQHFNAQYQHYPNIYPQNVYGYQSPLDPFPVRQAPIYPSPGAQPIGPPVPHPFYHQQGVYYPPQLYPSTTEANKPTTVYPKKN